MSKLNELYRPEGFNDPSLYYPEILVLQANCADFNGSTFDGSPFNVWMERDGLRKSLAYMDPDSLRWLRTGVLKISSVLVPVTPGGTDYASWEIRDHQPPFHITPPGYFMIRLRKDHSQMDWWAVDEDNQLVANGLFAISSTERLLLATSATDPQEDVC